MKVAEIENEIVVIKDREDEILNGRKRTKKLTLLKKKVENQAQKRM